jgi:hypothetical protein
MEWLFLTRPNKKQSNNKPWQIATRLLNTAITKGSDLQWQGDAKIVLEPVDAELLEAIRIAGDWEAGLGTMPSTIAAKIRMTGPELDCPRSRKESHTEMPEVVGSED